MASVVRAIPSRRALTSLLRGHRLPPSRLTAPIPGSNNIQTPITFTKTLCTSPAHCFRYDGIGSSSSSDKSLAEYISKQTDIALGITRKLLLTEANNSNLVCAPLSMQSVLSFFNPEDSTMDHSLAPELVARVFADGSQIGGSHLSFAHGLWVDKSVHLEPSLEQAVGTAYKAALNRVDFKTEYELVRTRVNSWAEKETNGLIKGVLSPGSVHSLTRLLFANVLYFKGAWDEKLYASLTKEDDFHLLNGNPVKSVPFMTSWKEQYINACDGFKVLRLLYRNGRQDERSYSMCLFLPDSKDGLPALMERMCAESDFLERHLPHRRVRVGDFRIPKFKFSFGFEASSVLEGLGLLRGLTEKVKSRVGEPLVVPTIFHKAVIEVNEDGTKAAAVTHGRMYGTACKPRLPRKEIDFVADHPFMFVIREEVTETVLFIGYVLNPLLHA
ncbi:hypothetical protein M0R45_024984 [Rubus argutus]|uniref:Serpin domain-containing protein n=1 Tax=Rubus argutus TaxID=59490 RepID=A0AAW1WT23_RUBAR